MSRINALRLNHLEIYTSFIAYYKENTTVRCSLPYLYTRKQEQASVRSQKNLAVVAMQCEYRRISVFVFSNI